MLSSSSSSSSHSEAKQEVDEEAVGGMSKIEMVEGKKVMAVGECLFHSKEPCCSLSSLAFQARKNSCFGLWYVWLYRLHAFSFVGDC